MGVAASSDKEENSSWRVVEVEVCGHDGGVNFDSREGGGGKERLRAMASIGSEASWLTGGRAQGWEAGVEG